MESFGWVSVTHNNAYVFRLEIGNRITRFEGEGILQNVRLFCENYEIFETSFGWEYAITYFNNSDYTEDWSYFISLENFEEFKCWMITSLTPVEQQRKDKLKKITEKLNECIKSL